jgi:hypothetical protein
MRFVFLLLGLVLAATTPAYPEADTRPLFKLPQDIEFTGPPDQLQSAIIFGDPHFAWAKDGEVMLQLTAIGPSGATLVPQKPQ